jgi:single-stranded DNA-binding protein
MNEVTLSGWVYKEPRILTYSSDKGNGKCATYMLLVENGFDYHKKDLIFIYSFGKRAEWVERYIKPNTKIILKGFLNNKKSIDGNGKVAYRLCVVACHHEFASSLPVSGSNQEMQEDYQTEMELQETAGAEISEKEMIEQFLLSSVNDFYE